MKTTPSMTLLWTNSLWRFCFLAVPRRFRHLFHRCRSVMARKSSTRLTEKRWCGKWVNALSITASGRTELIHPEICG